MFQAQAAGFKGSGSISAFAQYDSIVNTFQKDFDQFKQSIEQEHRQFLNTNDSVFAKFLKDSWLVLLAALVFGLGCSGIHGQLKPRIEQNARDKIARELRVLFGEETTVDEVIDPADPDGKRVLYYKASQNDETIGYALQANGGGFADKIILLVAVDAEFENLKGIAVLKSNETPGFGDKIKNAKFKDQFGNCPMGQKLIVTKRGDRGVVDYRIVSITGATISSQAVVDIVNGGAERLKEIVKQ